MRLHLLFAAMALVRALVVRPGALACGRRGLVSMSSINKSATLVLKLTQAPIKSTDNEKVKLMRSLLKTKKKRDELGLIVLEGHRQVIDAVAMGLAPTLVLVSERAVTSAPLADKLLDALSHCSSALGTQVGCVEESILDRACSDVVTSQGVVAAFSRPSAPAAASFNAAFPLIVLLDRPTDPGNVGTVIRTAFGLGADALVVVEGCDAFSPKVSRASMGTNLQLPILETTWDGGAVESLLSSLLPPSSPASSADSGSRVLQLLLAVPDPSADPYFSVDLSLPTVIAVGSEAHGLSDACFDLADDFSSPGPGAGTGKGLKVVVKKVFIPTARPLESFNAAMAATLLLGEAARQRFSSTSPSSSFSGKGEGAKVAAKDKGKSNNGKSSNEVQE